MIYTPTHAPFVERFNRTIKEMLYKYLQATGTKTFTNALPMIVDNYNNSRHSVIKMAPVQANNPKNIKVARVNIRNAGTRFRKPGIAIGNNVRTIIKRSGFAKGYHPRWSKTLKTIEDIQGRYYHTDDDKKWLFAHLQKIDDVSAVKAKPQLEGTLEGKLRELGPMKVSESSKQFKQRLEQEKQKNPVATRKGKRTKKQPTRFKDFV